MDDKNQRNMQHLLRKVLDLLRNARPADLDALLRGDARLSIVYKKQSGAKGGPTTADLDADESYLKLVIEDLNKCTTRVDGDRVLRSARLKKAQLQRMCRLLDVPAGSKETVGHLRDMIVDSTIGVKLRSRAILGG